jgi:hypothetical protein
MGAMPPAVHQHQLQQRRSFGSVGRGPERRGGGEDNAVAAATTAEDDNGNDNDNVVEAAGSVPLQRRISNRGQRPSCICCRRGQDDPTEDDRDAERRERRRGRTAVVDKGRRGQRHGRPRSMGKGCRPGVARLLSPHAAVCYGAIWLACGRDGGSELGSVFERRGPLRHGECPSR